MKVLWRERGVNEEKSIRLDACQIFSSEPREPRVISSGGRYIAKYTDLFSVLSN